MPAQKTAADHAADAADAVRQLNHAGLNAKAISAPEISLTVQNLITLIDRLPQALDQLSNHLVLDQRQGQVRMEDGSDPGPRVLEAETHLSDAESDLADIAGHLRKAGALLFTMGAPWPTDNKETTTE
ncbi:hypothetical protein [Streptomyces sp. NPDC059411]|uniref:hypothetical protein n=1 Tax=Streptomyces sp. NPDC059411 TaxID=3346825 RepID=UPI0036B369BA